MPIKSPTTIAYIASIAKLRTAISEAANLSARAEAALVVAESELAAAVLDDGVIDVQILHDRSEVARKNTALRRIEANRAGAKLQELESGFHSELDLAARHMIQALQAAAEKSEAEIIATLEKMATPGNRHESVIPAMAKICSGVFDRARAQANLRWVQQTVTTDNCPAEELAAAFEEAAALL